MPKFPIEATLRRRKSETIIADSREQAVAKFRYRHPRYQIESVGEEEVLGYCEVTGRPIFGDDDYSQDSEGVMWLNAKFD